MRTALSSAICVVVTGVVFGWGQTAVTGGETSSFEKDREAILSMAGEFEVLFNFEETVPLRPGYKLKSPYQEDATEMVTVVEDTGGRIALQHLLVTRGDKVVKHWKQVWTYEDPVIHEFLGKERWQRRELSPEEVKGTWSQRVTQVDDSPRYESYGRWVHEPAMSVWESEMTSRPLPRREHTKRDDYHVLMAVNRHIITVDGWVHEQDNIKRVLGEDGEEDELLVRERGLNYYDRTDDFDFTPAKEYWAATEAFWKQVDGYWQEVLKEEGPLNVKEKVGDRFLWRSMFELAKQVQESGEEVNAGDLEELFETFVVTKEGAEEKGKDS
ncbi:MAG: DUF6607 family protein [Verrucomicrobiota bacterium]